MLAALDLFANFVMVSQKANVQAVLEIEEEEAQVAVAAALEKPAA